MSTDIYSADRQHCAPLYFFQFLSHTSNQPKPLPVNLKNTIEYLSGYDMSDVRVHYNSPLPKCFQARAFAYGTDIYLRSGTEDTLLHEAWHVVQQKQGRVNVNSDNSLINLSEELEAEADIMALILSGSLNKNYQASGSMRSLKKCQAKPVVQCWLQIRNDGNLGARTWLTAAPVMVQLNNYHNINNNNTPGLLYAVKKLVKQNRTYTTLADVYNDTDNLRKPVFGYQHVQAFRAFMQQQNLARTNYIQARDAYVQNQRNAHDLRQVNARIARDFSERFSKDKYCTDNPPAYCFWKPRTNYNMISRTRSLFQSRPGLIAAHTPLVQWFLGQTNFPYGMNCWESVLYGAVASTNINQDYVKWAIKNKITMSLSSYLVNYGYSLAQARQDLGNTYANPAEVDNAEFLHYIFSNPEYHASDKDPNSIVQNGQKFPPFPNVIPRGQIVVLSAGGHVAISTGKTFPNQQPVAIAAFGANGHGILELDSDDQADFPTVRETTIEDRMAELPGYAYEIHTGWLPDVPVDTRVKIQYGSRLRNSGGRGNNIFNTNVLATNIYQNLF